MDERINSVTPHGIRITPSSHSTAMVPRCFFFRFWNHRTSSCAKTPSNRGAFGAVDAKLLKTKRTSGSHSLHRFGDNGQPNLSQPRSSSQRLLILVEPWGPSRDRHDSRSLPAIPLSRQRLPARSHKRPGPRRRCLLTASVEILRNLPHGRASVGRIRPRGILPNSVGLLAFSVMFRSSLARTTP